MISQRAKIGAAFAAVYIIWGSTYLAIRFVIETLPPFFMAGTRFTIAGLVLYVWMRIRGKTGEPASHWSRAFLVGGFMLLGGHGAVVWAEQWIPSGLTSLLIATVPLWMVFLDSIHTRAKPNNRILGGLALGFSGVVLLISNTESLNASSVELIGGVVVIFGAFLWANGSLYSRSAKLSSSQFLATAMEMIAGGLLLLGASLVTGEWAQVRLDQVSFRSFVSWLYLIVFGALVAFTAYIWLLKMTTPARVSTYAYVNPIVAMFLGWALASEPITPMNALAAVIIVVSVIVITTQQSKEIRSQKKNA